MLNSNHLTDPKSWLKSILELSPNFFWGKNFYSFFGLNWKPSTLLPSEGRFTIGRKMILFDFFPTRLNFRLKFQWKLLVSESLVTIDLSLHCHLNRTSNERSPFEHTDLFRTNFSPLPFRPQVEDAASLVWKFLKPGQKRNSFKEIDSAEDRWGFSSVEVIRCSCTTAGAI